MGYTLSNHGGVVRDDDGAHIPEDPGNRDWRDYLLWREAGGVPKPAASPAPVRVVAAADFIDLFTPDEYAALVAVPQLAHAAAKAMAQGTVNMDSPLLGQLMGLAVARGAITRARADAVVAGRRP